MRIKHIISITSLLSITPLAMASISCDENSLNNLGCTDASMYQTDSLDAPSNKKGVEWLANHFGKTRSDDSITYGKDSLVATADNKAKHWQQETLNSDKNNDRSVCRINSFGMTICN